MVERDSMRQGSRAARLSAIAFAGFVVTGVMLAAAPLGAANYTWVVSSGDWSVASNWNGTLPTSIDYAYVNNGGTAAVSQTNETCGTLSLGGKRIGANVRRRHVHKLPGTLAFRLGDLHAVGRD